jgi:uncharacterized damage-inducible protein DinB
MSDNATRAIADFLISDFQMEMQTTVKVMQAVPADHLDYRPDSLSKTALGLLRHLALEDEWLLNSIAAGEFNAPPDDSDACGISTPTEAVARYQEKVSAALERVRNTPPSQLEKVIDLLGMIQAPGLNLLALTLKHSIHHRGQLSAYLRAMGGKIPGIYGPSADTQAEAQSAARA